jgi:hypothetical protein
MRCFISTTGSFATAVSLAAALLTSLTAAAQSERFAREATSENKIFTLRIEPGRAGYSGRNCEATLFKRTRQGGPHPRRVWARHFVNETAPVHAFVRNDGRFVVTLDEHRRGGAQNSLVIYGERGQLLRHFLLQDLLAKGDFEHVSASRHKVTWLDGARFSFDDPRDEFVVELKWGRKIRVHLKRLEIIRSPDQAPPALAQIPPALLAELLAHEEGAAAELLAEREDWRKPPPVAIPDPDPADPADYLGLFNELGRVEGDDATPLYDAAFAQLTRWEGDRTVLDAALRGDPEALAAPETLAWLDANMVTLQLFSEASQYPSKSWSRDSGDGSMLGVMLPDLGEQRELARAALIDGRLLLEEGRPAAAANRYLDVMASAAHVASGWTLLESLVGVALGERSSQAMLDLVADPSVDVIDYDELAEAMEAADRPRRALSEAMQGERAMFMDGMQQMWQLDPRTGTYTIDRDKVVEVFDASTAAELLAAEDVGYEATVAAGNAAYDAMTRAAELPYLEAKPALEELNRRLQEDPDVNPFVREIVPGIMGVHFADTRGKACRRATQLVVRLKAYRQKHGEYPATLDVFEGAAFATDPFTGQPFVYHPHADDFVLYSVGGNGVDDGGVHDRDGRTNDLRFWPRPE